ncbi:MAG: acetamidase/formamidase family protein [Propionibacteriaceae bacterium]
MHRLEPTPSTTTDVFSRDHAPVLTINPGDQLVVDSLDAHGFRSPQTTPGEEQPRMFAAFRGHCLTGPIEVRGSQPGQWLAVRLESLRPGSWGWTNAAAVDNLVSERMGLTAADKVNLLWAIDADADMARTQIGERTFERPTAPFLGVLGTAPAESGEHSTIPPRPGSGGNIDCRDLVAGATLYLPVAVPGALLYLGDGHAAQGDGEVSGTAIECPMTTELTIEVITHPALTTIHAETPGGLVTFGFDADLNAAMGDALAAMITWLQQRLDLDRPTALALASTAVDLRITQIANWTWGVHAVLPPEVLTPTDSAETARDPVQG